MSREKLFCLLVLKKRVYSSISTLSLIFNLTQISSTASLTTYKWKWEKIYTYFFYTYIAQHSHERVIQSNSRGKKSPCMAWSEPFLPFHNHYIWMEIFLIFCHSTNKTNQLGGSDAIEKELLMNKNVFKIESLQPGLGLPPEVEHFCVLHIWMFF